MSAEVVLMDEPEEAVAPPILSQLVALVGGYWSAPPEAAEKRATIAPTGHLAGCRAAVKLGSVLKTPPGMAQFSPFDDEFRLRELEGAIQAMMCRQVGPGKLVRVGEVTWIEPLGAANRLDRVYRASYRYELATEGR